MAIDYSGYQDGLEGLEPTEDPTKIYKPEPVQPPAAKPEGNKEAAAEDGEERGSWIDQLSYGTRNFIDNKFLGDQENDDEVRQNYFDNKKEYEDERAANPITNVLDETTNAIGGGIAGAVEDIGETAELIGDTGKTVLGLAGESDNVFSDDYAQAEWNLGITENRTAVGKFSREAVSFVIKLKAAAALPIIGAAGVKGGVASRIGGEALRGAIADAITNPGDGNLSNALEEVAPGLKDTWVTALAIDDDDNPWMARLKNVVEGGVLGVAVDGVSELFGALRQGRAVLNATGSTDDAIDATIKAVRDPGYEQAAKLWDVQNPKNKFAGLEPTRQDEVLKNYRAQGALPAKAELPGYEARSIDNKVYGSDPQRPPMWEPEEAGKRQSSYDVNRVIKSQEALDKLGNPANGSSLPIMTDEAYQKVIGARDIQKNNIEQVEALRSTIAEVGSKIDVEALARDLGQSVDETTTKALVAVREFVASNADEAKLLSPAFKDSPYGAVDMRAFDSVTFKDDAGRMILNREAVVATKTLIRDTAMQINDIALDAVGVKGAMGDALQQNHMLLDRLQSLLRMHKVSAVHYGSGLNSFKIGSLTVGNSQASLSKALTKLDETFDGMRKLLDEGTPQSEKEFADIARGLSLSGGDPTKQISFMQLAARVGVRDAMTSLYNSLLSSPLSQARNIIGTTWATTLKPISQAIGFATNGDLDKAKVSLGAFHSFTESISEAWQVANTAWKTGIPVNEGAKFNSYVKETAQEVEALIKTAQTPTEKAAGAMLGMFHDFVNNPFMTLPTKALSVTDDFFKTLVGRMELKRQVFEQSLDAGSAGLKFDADKYAQLVTEKIGINGEILDTRLLETAKEITFQQDLTGFMKGVNNLANDNAVMKYFVPFIKTPHNLLRYSGTYLPGNRIVAPFASKIPALGTFYDAYAQAMKSGDDVLIAEMRGREAIGTFAVMSGVGAALAGNITGGGPTWDPKAYEVWRQTHEPHSIKVGDKWISYKQLEGINVLFSAVADSVELANLGAFNEYSDLLGAMTHIIAAATYDRSYFRGLQSAMSILNPRELSRGATLGKTALEGANNFLPFAGARRQLGNALAPGVYEWRNQYEKAIAAAVPGYRNMFGVRQVDMFTGKPKTSQPDNGLHLLNNFLPFNVKTAQEDPLMQTLTENGIDIGLGFPDTLKGIDLNPTQKGRLNELIAATGIHERLSSLVEKDWWNEDLERWKEARRRGEAGPKDGTRWYQEVEQELGKAKQAAIRQFRQEDPEFNNQYRQQRSQTLREQRGVYRQVERISSDPLR